MRPVTEGSPISWLQAGPGPLPVWKFGHRMMLLQDYPSLRLSVMRPSYKEWNLEKRREERKLVCCVFYGRREQRGVVQAAWAEAANEHTWFGTGRGESKAKA